MKNSFLLFFIACFTSLNLFSQTIEEQDKSIAAKNGIKTKTQLDYKYINGVASNTGSKSSVTTYAKSGDILQIDFLDSKGQVISWEKYAYDMIGNRTLFEREGSGSKYKKVSTYNANKDLIQETGFNGAENYKNDYNYSQPGVLSDVTYMVFTKINRRLIYEKEGNTTHVGIFTGGTSLTSKIKMINDAQGNLLEEAHYTVDDRETEKKTFKYNASKQLIEEVKTQAGKFYYRITQEYDAKGRLVKVSEETIAKEKYVKKSYTYDAAGNLTEFKWRRNADEEFNIKTYTYNTKGVCLSEHTFYPASKFELLSKYEYEYY
jgi:hypothetical protein